VAARARPLAPLLPGGLAIAWIVVVAGLSLFALAAAGDSPAALSLDPYVLRVAGFTLLQAALSVLCAVIPGVFVARALARRSGFPGRRLLLRLCALPLVLPALVAIFGIASVFGANGAVAEIARRTGLPEWHFPYGLAGILVAHCFFNVPLATRLLLPALESIPGETLRLARQLGMSGPQFFRLVEWPLLRRVLPGVAGLVFLLCFTSFAAVLVFGGGPAATTLEVAIFHALRTEFDISRAVALALLQVVMCAALVAAGQRFRLPTPLARTEARRDRRPGAASAPARLLDACWITAAALFAGGPLLATALRAALGPVERALFSDAFAVALLNSLAVGAGAGSLSLALGLCIGFTARDIRIRRGRARWADGMENAASLTLVISPVVLGAGLFLLFLPSGLVFDHGLVLAAVVAAFATLPFVVQTLGPPLDQILEHHERPCLALGIRGWDRFRIVEFPLLRPALARAFALAAGIAMGDLTAVALFGTGEAITLPLLLYRLMGAYRMDEAGVVAGALALLCLGGFVLFDRLGERDERD